MAKQISKEGRLLLELEYQTRRARSSGRGENRDKFYFLARRAIRRYRTALGDVRGKRVLIAGCSEGGVTPLARRGGSVFGIDIARLPIANFRDPDIGQITG